MTRWSTEGASGDAYAARFDELAARGVDVHGEAAFCEKIVHPPARVLDAGCGTGRVAIRLAARGFTCTGVDVDPSMLAVARGRSPAVHWVEADLATLDLGSTYDVVVAAGNVVPLVAPGSETAIVASLAAHLAPEGVLVAGFGLDREHLPMSAALVSLADYDAWCAAADLRLVGRFASWSGDPHLGGGYAVSVHGRHGSPTIS